MESPPPIRSLSLSPTVRKVLFDASADGLFLLGEGRVVEANETAARMPTIGARLDPDQRLLEGS